MPETIKLKFPVTVGGATITEVTMRRPTVNDQLIADALKGSDSEKGVAMIGNLCNMTPTDMRALDLADFKRLQELFQSFFD